MSDPHKHCGWCGGTLIPGPWPRSCENEECSQITYKNPTPVVVLGCLADDGSGNTGFVMVKRAIPPGTGRWAFPGGFVENHESIEDAAVREFKEETGFEVSVESIMLDHSANTGFGQVLIFCTVFDSRIDEEEWETFVPTDEVSEIMVVTSDGERPDICFPLHSAALDRFWR
jgi:ADP-ribose pyrophosphatase YjhB (NUDIX family)